MAIANVTLLNTFYEQMTSLNALIVEMNRVTEGYYITQGNLTILNSATASPLGLNVHVGGIRTNFIEVGPGSNTYPAITHKGTGNSNSGIYFSAANTMHFVTGSNTVITLRPSGNVGIGTTSPSQKLDVLGRVNITGHTVVTGNVGINKSSPALALDVVGSIWATGNITMESDATTKQNIRPIDDALLIVNAMTGVRYTKRETQDEKIGLVAQDVQKVLPQVVSENDGLLGINYPSIVGLLVQAIKELDNKIDRLKRDG
jgi:hypothetical protein